MRSYLDKYWYYTRLWWNTVSCTALNWLLSHYRLIELMGLIPLCQWRLQYSPKELQQYFELFYFLGHLADLFDLDRYTWTPRFELRTMMTQMSKDHAVFVRWQKMINTSQPKLQLLSYLIDAQYLTASQVYTARQTIERYL